jgi:hypothetical protein
LINFEILQSLGPLQNILQNSSKGWFLSFMCMFKPKAFHQNVRSLLKISSMISLFMNFTWCLKLKPFLKVMPQLLQTINHGLLAF